MSKMLKVFIAFSLICTSLVHAQVKSIKGVVTDGSGLPLPGVNIVVKGTTDGAQSDMDGNFEINAKEGNTLVFSFIGMKTIEAPATSSLMKVVLNDLENTLEEVVVTALGIKREKKALGYAAQEVSGETISSAGQTNALSSLSGNVAGVQVTAPSSMGGSVNITIRGINSVTQNNKPLIVINGIPVDNSNYNSTSTQSGSGGRDYGDASADINPDDIESVTVLKGGAAAALYGSRAQNGVIMYTTKSAKKGKAEVSFKSGVHFESAYISPILQNSYGGGYDETGLPSATINGQVYNIMEYYADESWGPKYDRNLMYLPWNAFDPEFPDQYLKEIPWVSPKNDVDSFFRTGVTTNNNVGLSFANDKSNIRASFSNQLTSGIVPNSNLTKNMFSINGGANLSSKFKFDAMMNYTSTKGFNRPEQGYGDNSVAQKFYQWGQRQLDYKDLQSYIKPNGQQRTWNRIDYDNPTPLYSDNPYWSIYKNYSDDDRNRFLGNIKLQYNFTDKLFAVANMYGDHYDFRVRERVAVGSQAQSGFSQTNYTNSEFNYEARLHYNDRFGNVSLNTFIGTNRRHTKSASLMGYTSGGIVIPDLYDLSNSVNLPISDNYQDRLRINSLYGMASLGFYDMFYLEGTVRKDWFSTVIKPGTYPSVTGSFIFSQLMKDSNWLSFGKVRAAWAQVSNGANPYSLKNYFSIGNSFNSTPTYYQNSIANNENLKPELNDTKEIGIEMKLWNNRLGFDVTYYNNETRDLITPVQSTGATGYTGKYFNAGKLQNKGIEAMVFVNPIRTEDFNWDIAWNFSKNNNKLLELNGVETLTLANAPFQVSLVAKVGERYGQIYGTDYVYDANGNKMVDDDGLYVTSGIKSLGSIIPDYNMGIRNTFTYKQISLSALLDIQKGGKYFSTSHMWGMYSGMLDKTANNNIRENGIILPGVNQTTGQPNDVVISAYDYGYNHYGNVDAQNVFNADYVKLREVTLGYTFPAKWFNNKISGLKFSAYGRNLFAWGLDWKGMDPENTSYGSGNIRGLEGGSLPSTRTYGASLEIKL